MAWARVAVLVPKTTSSTTTRGKAKKVRDNKTNALPGNLATQLRRVKVGERTLGVSVTIWDTYANANNANTVLNGTYGDQDFTNAIEHWDVLPLFEV